MYKITNKSKDVRKFRDSFTGKHIFVAPGKSEVTRTPVKESSIFKVEKISEERIITKNKLQPKEGD